MPLVLTIIRCYAVLTSFMRTGARARAGAAPGGPSLRMRAEDVSKMCASLRMRARMSQKT